MIDKDDSGSLDKAEVVRAVQTDKKVINFLINCGNENLQYLLVPARLEMALNTLDTDRDGEINMPEWESAIETALANKLEARAADREKKAKAAQKEIAEFTAEFLNAARKCFQMIDKDDSGTLTKTEIVKAVAEDKEVVKFLRTCGEENLQFLLQPARLEKALEVLDTSKDGEVDIDEWEEAIQRGLSKRLEQLAVERERRERAARAEDEAFSAEFLNAARQVFLMIDVDNSGSLDKAEVVKAVKTDKKVINFLVNCGNQNLQYLLVPARLEAALQTLDTDRDGEINMPEWESAIETALANKLEARAADREKKAKAARKEIEEFTAEFLNAARQCFQMIDKDSSGTLTKTEIVKAVAEDKDVVKFLRTCGEENLQFLLVPARLEKALEVLDTSKDGEVDIDEWEEAIHRGLAKRLEQLAEERERRERAARAEDEAFTAQFLNAAREVFLMIDKDDSGSLDKAEVIKAVKTDKKVINFLVNCGNENLQYLLVPARLEMALNTLRPREPRVHVCVGRICSHEATEDHTEAKEGRLCGRIPDGRAHRRRRRGRREGAQIADAPAGPLASDVFGRFADAGAGANTRGPTTARGSSHPQARQDQLLCAAAHGASVAVAAKAWLSGHGLPRAARTVESGPECFRARQPRLARPPDRRARHLLARPHRFT
jgi:Ca2+-binding EF-hand superfamily protein